MGEAKRREKLALPPRQKVVKINFIDIFLGFQLLNLELKNILTWE